MLTHLLNRHRCCPLAIWGFPTRLPLSWSLWKKLPPFGSSLSSSVQIPTRPSDFCLPPLFPSTSMHHQSCPCTHIHGMCVYVCVCVMEAGWVTDWLFVQSMHLTYPSWAAIWCWKSLWDLPSLELYQQMLPFVVSTYGKCCPPGGRGPSCHMWMNSALACILTCFLRRQKGSGRAPAILVHCWHPHQCRPCLGASSIMYIIEKSLRIHVLGPSIEMQFFSFCTEQNWSMLEGLHYWDGDTSFFPLPHLLFLTGLLLLSPRRVGHPALSLSLNIISVTPLPWL